MTPQPPSSYPNRFPLQPGWALKRVLEAGYTKQKFLADLKAGVTVGIVAIPLAMALGVASGMTPQAGLYTAIIPAILAALLGGSKFQVSGPTAAFVALLVPVVSQFGPSGLMVAGLLAGFILILMSVLHLAEAIQYIPHPVTTGFTSGIAVVIGVVQVKDFFGLDFQTNPQNFWERLIAIEHALPSLKPLETAVAISTLIILYWSTRFIKKIPAPVVALIFITVLTYIVQKIFPDISILTIEKKFSYLMHGQLEKGIPSSVPGFVLPWNAQIAGTAAYKLTWPNIISILPYAFSIALLGAIESLVTAVVADGATGKKHNPNTELFAQGVANVVSPFFGGFASTGAMSRTMTGIRFGSVSPFTAVIHSITVLFAILFFSSFINQVPVATLAAILVFIAVNMFDKKHF
ncbi:MAG: SulP family inorganic anion transporter, partial [Bdellovibrionota bacterium]